MKNIMTPNSFTAPEFYNIYEEEQKAKEKSFVSLNEYCMEVQKTLKGAIITVNVLVIIMVSMTGLSYFFASRGNIDSFGYFLITVTLLVIINSIRTIIKECKSEIFDTCKIFKDYYSVDVEE